MRGALKAGRWCRTAPVGYKNSRDEQNKPIIVPSNSAEYIVLAFTMISNGHAQSEVLRALKDKPVNIKKVTFLCYFVIPFTLGKL